MICYRDMTFCTSDKTGCINVECHRHHTHTKANVTDLPVAWMDFSDSCGFFRLPEYVEQQGDGE